MPIYDFVCDSCQHSFEVRKGWNEEPTAQCERCGANAHKMFATPTIIYKGSGFYTTDYKNRSVDSTSRSNGNGKKAPADSKAKPSTTEGKSATKKSDSKPQKA